MATTVASFTIYSQLTIIYIALFTMQFVLKQLYSIKREIVSFSSDQTNSAV